MIYTQLVQNLKKKHYTMSGEDEGSLNQTCL